jgi:diadenosine tetraphosphate (Ap4A) HIT family hydrolase
VPSIFTKIINGELPGRFVYRDDDVVAFLTIAPVRPGHTLVVPVQEIDSWLDLPDQLRDRLFAVSQRVGAAIDRAFRPQKVAVLLLGLEVPHAHVHLLPIDSEAQVDFSRADHSADPAALDEAAERIRAELR